MRKLSVFLIVSIAIAGAFAFYKFFFGKVPLDDRPLSIVEIEELVYRDPFDYKMQFKLARTGWNKFEHSMKTDQDVGSESITAYLISCVESGENREIYNELEKHFREVSRLMSLPYEDFSETYRKFKDIYQLGPRRNIKVIIDVRNDFESVWASIGTDYQSQGMGQAQRAVKRYLRAAYDVEVGQKQVVIPSHGESTFHFTQKFYANWRQALHSYGIVLPKRTGLPSDFVLKGAVTSPIDPNIGQIASGESVGRFQLSNGDEVVPGLQYFKDIINRQGARAGGSQNSSQIAEQVKSITTRESPSDMYRLFLSLQDQGRWSEMIDMIDPLTRDKVAKDLKRALLPLAPNEDAISRLNAMSARNLLVVVLKNSTPNTVEIVSDEVHGNEGIVHTRTRKGGAYFSSTVPVRKVDGEWKIVWDQSVK